MIEDDQGSEPSSESDTDDIQIDHKYFTRSRGGNVTYTASLQEEEMQIEDRSWDRRTGVDAFENDGRLMFGAAASKRNKNSILLDQGADRSSTARNNSPLISR